jgi:hypothetical protein
MYTYPYQILKKRLTAQVAELKLVDWYLDQYNKKDKATLMLIEPAVFIEFRPITTQQLSFGHQMAETEIIVHLVTTNMFDNDKRVKKSVARDHAQLVDDIYKALSGFSAKLSYLDEFAALANTPNDKTIFNSITRDGLPVTPHAIRGLQITLQLFTTLVFDHADVKTTTSADPELNITPAVN